MNGYYSLSMTNGVPGVIGFLGEVILARIEEERAYRLLESAVRWLIARERPPHSKSRYSVWFIPGRDAPDTTLKWCEGDLGIGAILYQVGSRIGRSDWRDYGQGLIERCATRISETPYADIRCLDSGTFGIAHVFNRMYQLTGTEPFQRAAKHWYSHSLIATESGQAGGSQSISNSNAPLMSESVGVMLTLLSSLHAWEPEWDRLLLLSGCERTWW
jgi:lantibiotic biosynthesis protein